MISVVYNRYVNEPATIFDFACEIKLEKSWHYSCRDFLNSLYDMSKKSQSSLFSWMKKVRLVFLITFLFN